MARRCSTLGRPIGKHDYQFLIDDPRRFRAGLDRAFDAGPQRFPKAFAEGYRLKDVRTWRRTGLRRRRIRLKTTGESFSVRPSFMLPYRTGRTDDVQGPLFLRTFGVPFWALTRVFGKNAMYGYRLEARLGRSSLVGTPVRRVEVPAHRLADEHHQSRDGTKNYIATTVGAGCCPGAALAQTATTEDLTIAYGVFRQEAEQAPAGYQPATVSVDGWASTQQAWRALFPLVVLLRCFLHGWLGIRSRGKLTGVFTELSAWLFEQVEKLCSRSGEYGVAYAHPGGHRTSNMLDRVIRSMSRYFEDGQHLHGSPAACGRDVRAWALLPNLRPWGPQAVGDNNGWRSPAARLNAVRYHEDWLQNLQIAASLGGYRR